MDDKTLEMLQKLTGLIEQHTHTIRNIVDIQKMLAEKLEHLEKQLNDMKTLVLEDKSDEVGK